MSYNNKFYNTLNQPYEEYTFQNNMLAPNRFAFPPPPLPVMQYSKSSPISDEDFIKKWEQIAVDRPVKKVKRNNLNIGMMRQQFQSIIKTIQELKEKEVYLKANMSAISDSEWKEQLNQVNKNRALIDGGLIGFNDTCIELLRNALEKRSTKRMRLKRRRLEQNIEKQQLTKKLEERSRNIDENLQKVKDAILKAKQEKESKIQADLILREVLRKKLDAKKYIAKLEALVKLRKARMNTARGRGDVVSEGETIAFKDSIEKLYSLWSQKLLIYDKEETDLRAKLEEDSGSKALKTSEIEDSVKENFARWRKFLFGNRKNMPQRDFGGNSNSFVAVRSQWDQYLSSEGTPLPVGWVIPA